MLQISIQEGEMWDEGTKSFIIVKSQTLQLEHSLVSLSKWESKWQKPFLTKDEKTQEEILDYIRCMTLTSNVDPNVYNFITEDDYKKITAYIESPMTATTFVKDNTPPNREIITSEIIYYWMVALTIPFECQKWHLNRLLTLIRVCNIKNSPGKKMSKSALAKRNSSLNAARRSRSHSRG